MIQTYINGELYEGLAGWHITEQLGNKTLSEVKIAIGAGQAAPVAGDII